MTSRRRTKGRPVADGLNAGGCDFAVDPSLEAHRAEVWWRPEIDIELIQVQPTSSPHDARLKPPKGAQGGETWWSIGTGREKTRLALLAREADPSQPLAAVIPIDEALPARLKALARLWRQLDGAPAGPDPITPQRRRRMKAMIRAWDGWFSGAAYREIANALYGPRRVAADPWKSSSLRDATMRLVRDGRAMIGGGYYRLLDGRQNT